MKAKAKALLTSVLAMGMVAAVAGSGVFALISDVEVSDQNVLQAGSLDLKTDGGDGTTTFAVRDVKPTFEGRGADVLINIGKNPGNLTIEIKDGDIINAPGITFEPEPLPDHGELGAAAEMAIYVDVDNDGDPGAGDVGLSSVSLDPLFSDECVQYVPVTLIFDKINNYEGCKWSDVTTLQPGAHTEADEDNPAAQRFVVHWEVPEDVGSEIMDDQVFVKFTFRLDQLQQFDEFDQDPFIE